MRSILVLVFKQCFNCSIDLLSIIRTVAMTRAFSCVCECVFFFFGWKSCIKGGVTVVVPELESISNFFGHTSLRLAFVARVV